MPKVILRAEARAAGLKRFYTGAPCSKGHDAERHVSSSGCVMCASIRAKQENPDRVRERGRKKRARWRAANPEKSRQESAEWRRANPDKSRESSRRFYAENAEKLREQAREASRRKRELDPAAINERKRIYRAANPEKHRGWYRNSYLKDPEIFKIKARQRKARLRGAVGKYTKADIVNILERQNHRCPVCNADLISVGYHADHITPLIKGGTNWPDNIQCLCPTCNLQKNDMDFDVFLQRKLSGGDLCAC